MCTKSLMSDALWFDVEQRYKTTNHHRKHGDSTLWFDVEQRYKTTGLFVRFSLQRCGLM